MAGPLPAHLLPDTTIIDGIYEEYPELLDYLG